jgi:diguanylate cyclase (GGDEF)-like protein
MSFRYKLIFGVAVIQGILLVILVWNSLHALRVSNEEEFLKRSTTTAQLFASSSQAAVLSTDLGSLDSAVREIVASPGIVYARIYAGDQVLAEAGDRVLLARRFIPDQSLESVRDGVFDKTAEISVAGQQYGKIELGFSVGAITGLLTQTRDRTLLLVGVDLILIVLFTLVLGLYVTRRLKALRAASASIAQGKFGYQLDIRGRDELAQTAVAFNEMSTQLKHLDEQRRQAEAEILSLNQDLERRVHQRTNELVTLNSELEHQALHDALTRLPNRTLLNDRLLQAIRIGTREKKSFALVAVDLDLFKEINDTLGHNAGDLVLQEVASRMRLALRDSDTVARMGGDEFAILLLNVADQATAQSLTQRIHQAVREPLTLEGKVLEVGASMGIAIFSDHGSTAEDLTRHADAAMYAAKQDKSGIVLYSAELERSSSDRVTRKGELRRALSNGELLLHYQPKFDLASGAVTGVEALVRWQHAQHGLIFPDNFIPLAEESGLIKPLTQEVQRIALRQCKQWLDAGIPLAVAVNISAINLQDPDFPDQVAGLLRESQVPASMLELEVTETAIMTDPLRAMQNIARLSEMGIQVSIDDFGTGYSSMAYLKKLLVAKIKIDKSFVMDMHRDSNDAVIVRSTIDLGHNLGLKVVAEGVEDQQSWDRLKALGCDAAQGYHMSKPLPAEQFLHWYNNLAMPGTQSRFTR